MSRWIPDEEGVGCFICHSEFSLIRRRHHCRKCGALVCGNCSDHFLPDRVCDSCELQLKEASYVTERLDVNGQIGESLKVSLREKTGEIELYKHFSESFPNVSLICRNHREMTQIYDQVKSDSAVIEREIRMVARRCLRAESIANQTAEISREIESYSLQIGRQQKLTTQLHERIDRMRSEGPRPGSASPSIRSRSPEPSVCEIRPVAATLCQLTKKLLFS